MRRFILGRFLEILPVVLMVSVLSFLIIHLAPGDPVNMYIRPDMTESDIEELRVNMGLNGSVPQQYWAWLKTAVRGNWGYSLINNRPVARQIFEKLPATILLMGTSLLLSVVCAIPLGLWAGLKKNRLADRAISLFSYVGISIPSFWFAIMLIIVFALTFKWLPSSGMRTVGSSSLPDTLRHLVLPSVVLSFGNTAVFTRYIRANTISQMQEDYVQTAKAKGVPRRDILLRHVLKNCLLPVITLAGMNLVGLVTGSFIIESVFAWPGMGTLGMSAINNRDYPVIMGFTMLSCLILIFGNLAADLLYMVADPRIKQGARGKNA